MNNIVVLDTNVWVNALSEQGNAAYQLNCLYLITDFLQNRSVMLAVDQGNVILSEYSDNLNSNMYFQIFIKQLHREKRFYYIDGTLSPKMRKELEEVGFHEKEDQTFVATANNSGKYIISDDSDYGTHGEEDKQEAYEYITGKLHICLENSEEGFKRFQNMLKIST